MQMLIFFSGRRPPSPPGSSRRWEGGVGGLDGGWIKQWTDEFRQAGLAPAGMSWLVREARRRRRHSFIRGEAV